jgi:hypothetical protein
MPGIRAAQLKPQAERAKEQYFISLYVRGGATDEGIPYAERRACLVPGTGSPHTRNRAEPLGGSTSSGG